MRWNLQVPTAARAAPPSGACPAPLLPACSCRPAQAAGPRAPRAGSEQGLCDAEPPSPHVQARASLSGPGLWRWLGLQSRVTSGRRGIAAIRRGRKMAAASEELNGAGTPGGGVGRSFGRELGPGMPRVREPSMFLWCSLFFLSFFYFLFWVVIFSFLSYGSMKKRWVSPHLIPQPLIFKFFLNLVCVLDSFPISLDSLRSAVHGPGGGNRGCWPSSASVSPRLFKRDADRVGEDGPGRPRNSKTRRQIVIVKICPVLGKFLIFKIDFEYLFGDVDRF